MPERLSLLTGSQLARSPIANRQRCVNYYPEGNARDAPVPMTHYQRPGLRPVAAATSQAPVRGLFRASNGQGYVVIGQTVYALAAPPSWTLTKIGTLGAALTTPCSMTDNSIEALLVDNSQQGYSWNLNSNNFSTFVDPTGLFQGATRVDVIDGFIVWNQPRTNQFSSTLDFTLTIDQTYSAGKVNYPDPIQSLIVNHHELILVGEVTGETWYDAGNTGFPFAELPGADHEHGTPAPYSLAEADVSAFWLGQTRQGQGVVMEASGYQARRISNHPLEVAIRRLQWTVGIGDAIGFTFQQDGHLFYILTFPAGDQTWVFDKSTGEWSQWAWTDANGGLHRFRANCFAFIYGVPLVGDWQTGEIFALDPAVFTDTVGGIVYPISFIRGFPHVQSGLVNLGGPGLDRQVPWGGQRVKISRFSLDLECGNGPKDSQGNPAGVLLRTSLDRGKTFYDVALQSTGLPGQFETQPMWLQPSGIARDIVFEIEHSIAGEAALNGAWAEVEVLGS